MKTLNQIYAEMNKDQDNRLTNKGDWEHGGYFRSHIDLYEEILTPYRESATRVFEIGINKGGSVRMWAEYFSKAHIFGMDSRKGIIENMRNARYEHKERITSLRLNQNDPVQLQAFADEYGFHPWEKFDVGIDDGSHRWEDQLKTFEILWPTIKDDGLYVMEDTLNSYDPNVPSNQGQNPVDYFKDLVDKINFYGALNGSADVSDPDKMQSTIGWIGFRYNCVFIKKQFISHK